MVEVEVNHVKLDVCSDCGGVWMDWGELSNVSSNIVTEHELKHRGKSDLKCPKCGNKMTVADLHSVLVDECKCGIFFDKAEAGKVVGEKFNILLEDSVKEVQIDKTQIKELLETGSTKIGEINIILKK